MVDNHSLGPNARLVEDGVDDKLGSLQFVFEVRGVNQDQFVSLGGDLDVTFKNFQFVFAILVQTDFAYAEAGGRLEIIGNDLENVFG